MRYPSSNKTYQKKVSHANRGMALEELINDANKYYLDNNIAIIYKKSTPIGIVNVKNDKSSKTITKAYFKEPSTLDYNGVYKGRYIEFDAKKTENKSFPLANISAHQLEHIKNVINHQGVVFIIININQEYYVLTGEKILSFTNSYQRKSIPIDYIKKNGYKITSYRNILLNYIVVVDEILEALYEKN